MDRRFAEAYEGYAGWHWWFRGRRRIVESVLRREVGSRSSLSIASIGCGPPGSLSWLTPFTADGGRLVGADADPTHGRSRSRAPGTSFADPPIDGGYPGSVARFVVGTCEAAPFASGSFDVLLAMDVLEHLEDDVLGLREAARMTKPGGLVLVTVPALPWLWGPHDEVNHHKRRYTADMLRRLFSDAGLASPRITYFNTLLFPPIAAARCLRPGKGAPEAARTDFDGARPGILNEVLAAVFSLERWWVGRVPVPIGVSLLAAARA